MTRETRIGLLVGLGFIVMFGLVLTELTGTGKPASLPPVLKDTATELAMTTPLEDVSPAVVNPLDSPPRLGRPIESPTPSTGTPLMASTPQTPAPASVLPPPRPEPEVVAVIHRTGESPPIASAQPAGSAIGSPKVTPATDVSPLTLAAEAAPARTYTVQPKDSLIKIAGKIYGPDRQDDYKRILEANKDKIKHPSLLAVGQELVIPELDVKLPAGPPGPADVKQVDLDQLAKALTPGDAETAKAEPAKDAQPAAKSIYVVQRGDTLTRIARKTLKDDSRATIMRIVDANKGKLSHPDRLPVGLRLEIPS
jgi:nucleoid-associated protein YgaU